MVITFSDHFWFATVNQDFFSVFLSQVFIGDAGLTGGDRGEDIAYFSVLVPAYLGHQFLQLSYPVAKCWWFSLFKSQ